MSVIFSPVAALELLLKIDRKVALPLVAGLAVMAAGAIVSTWQVDWRTMALIGIYVVCLGVILVTVANLSEGPRLLLGWFVVLMIIAIVSTLFVSAVFRPRTVAPTWCLVQFWNKCEDATAIVAERNSEQLVAATSVPAVIPAPTSTTGELQTSSSGDVPLLQQQVFIQFAGLITRESVIELNRALRRGGWQVASDSGERTENARGLNEVRYGPAADRDAAETLAAAVTAANIGSAPVQVKQLDMIRPNTLELWISN